MPDLKERLEDVEGRRQTRTERALAELEANEQGGERTPEANERKKKKKPTTTAPAAVGVGQSSFDLDGAIAKIQARIAATNDPTLKAKLAARIQALKDNAVQ